MFLFERSIENIVLDLTGSTGWEENEKFLEKVKQLVKKQFSNKEGFAYATKHNRPIKGIENKALQCNAKDLSNNIGLLIYDDFDMDETSVLIISNNKEHIQKWTRAGMNTVYLKTDYYNWELDLSAMPDEVWDMDKFYHFADNGSLRFSYPTEQLVRFSNLPLSNSNVVPFKQQRKIPDTDHEATIIFTGRYFTMKDNRHYNHPLTRAILGFKNGYRNQPKVVKKAFGKMIDHYIEHDVSISQVCFVPPRPNKKSRFIGIEKHMKSSTEVEFDLLRSTSDYSSPSKHATFEEKYQCVKGHIASERKTAGHVLLIDDVFTSGATTLECARVLHKAGANKVTVLPLAFTQKYDIHETPLPMMFNDDGNIYQINFNQQTHEAYWGAKKNKGGYDFKGFQTINEQYTAYYEKRFAKPFVVQKYSADKEIKAVIFDLDNTLIKTDHLEYYREKQQQIEDASLIEQAHIMIAPEILEKLQNKGYKVGIVTRSPRKYAESLLSISGYLYDSLVAAKDTYRTKPYPDPLLKCAKRLKVDPSYILNIGDLPIDLKAGDDAGTMSLDVLEVISEKILEDIINHSSRSELVE